jgi:ankyrin repeat protein
VYKGDKELADLLIRAGANVKAANREGSTPLWLASCQRRRADDCRAASRQVLDSEREAADRSPYTDHIAARQATMKALEVLVEAGADVNAKETLRGTTP